MAPSTVALLVLNGVLVVLNSPAVIAQIAQKNSGSICLGCWVLLANLNAFVNMIVWYGDAENKAPVWCDISVKLRLGYEVGRLASVLCIARFLAYIVSPQATALTKQDRRSRAIFDYCLAVGMPIAVMATHIIYQPNRYNVVRGYGCTPTQILSWPTLVFRTVWPPTFALIAVLYSIYTIYRIVKHRRDYRRVVTGAHSALTTGRFIRLAALAFSYLAIGAPLAVYSTIVNIKESGRYYEYNWRYFHSTPSALQLRPGRFTELPTRRVSAQ
ncbi:a-factor receptor [Microbotryomycetes sp. JL201]|nr:a-factor receptor [Microbotryomycetes sp. JL201]